MLLVWQVFCGNKYNFVKRIQTIVKTEIKKLSDKIVENISLVRS